MYNYKILLLFLLMSSCSFCGDQNLVGEYEQLNFPEDIWLLESGYINDFPATKQGGYFDEEKGVVVKNNTSENSSKSLWYIDDSIMVFTKPDDIIRRDKLFMRYVRCVSELYPMLSSSAKIVDGRDPVEVIRRVVDWGVEAAKVDENMLSAKLDGIFNFLIELEKGSGENSFSFSIPIKSLPEEIDTGLAWLMYSKVADKMHFFEWEFSKSANKQAKILRDYLDEMYKMYNITTQQFKKGIKVDVTSK